MSSNNMKTDVVIVGGGIAGLTCGVALTEIGMDVVVIEKKTTLGGRARSWNDQQTGDPVHIGPHILLSEYPNFLKLMNKLGTRNRIVWQDDIFVTIVEGQKKYEKRQTDWLPAPLKYVPSEMQDDSYSQADILSNLPVLLYSLMMDEEDVKRLDTMNAYGFLKAMGVRDRFIDSVWRFTCRSIMNCPLELCSAGALMRFYQRFIGYDGYKVGFPDGGLGDLFAPDSKKHIEQNEGLVLLDTEVTELIRNGSSVEGVVLDDGRRIEANYCVSGLPVRPLQNLLPRTWLKKFDPLSELGIFQPCPYISPYIWFDRKLTDMKFWARRYNYTDLNCDFYDLSNINSDRESNNSLITSNIIYSQRMGDLSDQEIIDVTLDELSDFLPEVKEATVEHSVVNRIPLAIHCPYPGVEQRRPSPDPPVEGLVLSGDWIDTGLPSSMESAAKSGWMAAETILEKENQSRQLTAEERDVEGIAKYIRDMGQWSTIRQIRKLIPPNQSG